MLFFFVPPAPRLKQQCCQWDRKIFKDTDYSIKSLEKKKLCWLFSLLVLLTMLSLRQEVAIHFPKMPLITMRYQTEFIILLCSVHSQKYTLGSSMALKWISLNSQIICKVAVILKCSCVFKRPGTSTVIDGPALFYLLCLAIGHWAHPSCVRTNNCCPHCQYCYV